MWRYEKKTNKVKMLCTNRFSAIFENDFSTICGTAVERKDEAHLLTPSLRSCLMECTVSNKLANEIMEYKHTSLLA